jgi:uncharacterized membrane protein YhaH (DUF805 family)
MDWKTLFLNANGRIGQKDFWIGFAILFVVGFILGLIPVIGQLASIILLFPWVCLYSKRLHDFGKTGWLVLVPIGVVLVATVIAAMTGGMAMLAGAGAGDAGAATAAMAGLGTMGLVMIVALLVCLGFLLWVGLTKGDPGENQYGPPPTSLIGGDATTTPAA